MKKEDLEQQAKAWQKSFEKQMKATLEACQWQMQEGITIKPLYTPSDLDERGFQHSFPGQHPFVRGVQPSGYVGRPWTIRQYAGFSTAEESNAFYRANLEAGQQGISVAFDLATHRGYDSDHPRVSGDVGKAGVAIDTVEDMKILFDGIPLDTTSVSMTMNGAVLPVMAFYIVAAEEQGVSPDVLAGTIQNDILKEFMVRNTYIYPPEPSMRIVQDIIAYATDHMPKFNPVSISGYHIQEAGADAALELAYTLANGRAYVRHAIAKGLKIDDFAPRLSFFFGIGLHFLMEVAKLRAARLLWSEIMRDLGAQDDKSCMMRFHCQTSGWSLTAKDPYNNIIRTTIEAMAAVFGGTQSLHTNAFDEALALPSLFSSRIARNTQLVLQEETDILHTMDPFGGSYMMESLTHDLCEKVKELMAEIDSAGGMLRAIESGLPQRRIAQAAAERQVRIDRGEEPIIGVNKYQNESEEPIDVLSIDTHEVLDQQKNKLRQVKKQRDEKQVKASLALLRQAASDPQANLLEVAIVAARARATLGEMSLVLEEVYGRYQGKVTQVQGIFNKGYKQDPRWQDLVDRIHVFAQQEGRQPRILVAKLGQDGHDRGAKVIAAGFVDLGFDVDLSPLFTTPEEVLRMAIDMDVHIIGVSTLAGGHSALVPELMQLMKEQGIQDIQVVVGGVIPDQDHQALLDAGVTYIATPGTSIIDAAEAVFERLSGDQ
ncbi:MAG: methylmalonyl-CoA mutase [Pseudomonadota bacterium]|nr:methylmalonyl-CoA mutase [Pseudomonadota bacterium]